MSQISKTIMGVLALSVACGAVQLAFGHDLAGLSAVRNQVASVASESGINRAAKADRDAIKAAPAATQTVALQINGMIDTSVLVRMPTVKAAMKNEARDRPAPSMLKSGGHKNAVACEPMVSILTEVAKLLQPGRCVT